VQVFEPQVDRGQVLRDGDTVACASTVYLNPEAMELSASQTVKGFAPHTKILNVDASSKQEVSPSARFDKTQQLTTGTLLCDPNAKSLKCRSFENVKKKISRSLNS
jgi:hypothetical protein